MKSQRLRVFNIAKSRKWRTLYDIRQEIYDRFGVIDSECAISARLRDYSNVRDGFIKERMKKPNSRNAWLYRIVKA